MKAETTLLVDGTNNFVRNYTIVPTLDANGNPIGGVVGFLKSLRAFIHLCKPQRVVIVFDGPGGSVRRRTINANYKAGRKPPRLNRNYESSPKEDAENKKFQAKRLREYLEDLPVHVIEIPNIEADDVIAYCTRKIPGRKVIVSNDADFIQLLNADTVIYRPTKKVFYTAKECLDEHKIHPSNFAVARSLAGDDSDNLPGVKGVGLKKAAHYFPFLSGSEQISVQDILEYSQANSKTHAKFVESSSLIEGNYSLMQLRDPCISVHNLGVICSYLSSSPSLNTTAFRVKLLKDGISELNDNFLHAFHGLG